MIEFTCGKKRCRVHIVVPEPPWINEALRVDELVPVYRVAVPAESGEEGVTLYGIDVAMTLGNETIAEVTGLPVAVSGEVSGLSVHLDIMMYGVPPVKYNVNVERLNARVEK